MVPLFQKIFNLAQCIFLYILKNEFMILQLLFYLILTFVQPKARIYPIHNFKSQSEDGKKYF